ncbi:MAG: retroviral-like aspartic protease family protein [Defluviitaleaceae bacterium]|nr:retroviral-like aspartic protease family protein [Defluviitaleaceae bacterium]
MYILDKKPIEIPFTSDSPGRVNISLDLSTSDFRNFGNVDFKLDTGSDFVTVNIEDLHRLGYTDNQLKSCPIHGIATTADGKEVKLQYMTNISIKYKERELQQATIYFALGTQMRNLLGNNWLKYFDIEIKRKASLLTLAETTEPPQLTDGEIPMQIYDLHGRTPK